MRSTVVAVCLALAAGSAFAAGPITIHGSSSMSELNDALAAGYRKTAPSATFAIEVSDSSKGIADLIGRRTQLAASSRPITPKESAQLPGLMTVGVARDGVAIYVHPSNPVAALSLDQIHDIFTGKTANWKEVGGPNAPIQVFTREPQSGTRAYVTEKIMNAAPFPPGAQVTESTAAMLSAVARDPHAIGYAHYVYSRTIKPLGISSVGTVVHLTKDSVENGTYPVSRTLSYYTEAPDAQASAFLKWLKSAEAQEIIVRAGFFSAR